MTETKQIPEIDNLTWTEKTVTTKSGPRKLRITTPNDGLWGLYREHKDALRDAGFAASKFGGAWTFNWWATTEGEFRYPELPELDSEAPDALELKPLVNESAIDPRFKFQIPLIQQTVAAMERYGATLNGCTTGVGKTFITLFSALEREKKIIVICPKPIVPDWQRAAFTVGVEALGVFGWEWIKTGKTPFGHWEMETVNKGKKNERQVKGDFIWTLPDGVEIVFDEIHRAAAIDTKNAHIVLRAAAQGIPIYGLSATIANDPTKMRAVGFVLGLHKDGRDFYDWMRKHGVVEQKLPMAGRTITIYKFRGSARHLQAIHKTIFPVKGCRVRADQLGDAFPQTQILAKAYEMDEASDIAKAYAEMQKKVDEIMYQKDVKSSEKQANILVEILRARQRVELLKVPLMVSLTKDALEEGNSVFLGVNFRDTLKELVDALKIKSIIQGGQKDHDRRNMIDAFQNNKHRVLAGIIKACREGLNLHDIHGGHPRMALISPTPSAFDLKQVLGRVHRAGGLSPSIQRVLFAAGTVEEEVCESLATKLDCLDLLMDGHLQKGIFPSTYSDMRSDTEKEEEV